MKINRKVQILALLLVVLLVGSFTACSCSTFDFSKVSYEGYNYEQITKHYSEAEISLATTSSKLSAVNTLNKAVNYINEVSNQYQLINLQYDLDQENAATRDERSRVYMEYSTLYSWYYKLLGVALANNNLGRAFFDYDDEWIAEIERTNMTQDAEYLAYMSEIAAIEDSYTGLHKSLVDEDKKAGINRTPDEFYEEYSNRAGELLLDLRDTYYNMTTAKLTGFDSYADYAYKVVYSRDYTPAQVSTLSGAVKDSFKNYYSKINNKISSVSTSTSTSGLVVKPSAIGNNIVDKNKSVIKNYMQSVSKDMVTAFDFMDESNLYVTTTNENAYQGAYASYLSKYEAPFIYQYVGNKGNMSDLSTFIHEFGHFYAFYKSNTSNIPLDIAEIQSQANEWLFMPTGKLLAANPTAYELSELLSSIYSSVQMGCVLDELQQKIYADDGTLYSEGSDVTQLFSDLLVEYGAVRDTFMPELNVTVDFKYWWSRVPHTFSSPFYYISYAVSMLPALEIYKISTTNQTTAISAYNQIINKGKDLTYSQMLNSVSIPSPFTASTISNLATFIESHWKL